MRWCAYVTQTDENVQVYLPVFFKYRSRQIIIITSRFAEAYILPQSMKIIFAKYPFIEKATIICETVNGLFIFNWKAFTNFTAK